MGAWNPKEFKDVCLQSGLSRALVYAESLVVKNWAAIYHKENIGKRLNKLRATGLRSSPEQILQYEKEITFELDALMATLNSMWDILAQLLNEYFVQIDSSEVSFSKFSNPKECCYRLIPSEIQPILQSIRGNTLYRTIKAYTNVSKHRYLPLGESYMNVSAMPREVSYTTPEFEYKNGERQRLAIDKAFKCLEFVIKSVDQIGAKIHELMK